jgi:hypothetical protein
METLQFIPSMQHTQQAASMWPWCRPPDDPTTTSSSSKETEMNRTRFSAIAIAFAALSAGQAMAAGPIVNGEIYPADAVAQSSTVTRAQVKAELADAARAGVLAQNGEIPAQAAIQTAGKSRDEVRAELATALRNGTVLNHIGA